MPKWKKDETKFEMSVIDDGKGSRYVRIPKPLDDILGRPDKVLFSINGKRIVLSEI